MYLTAVLAIGMVILAPVALAAKENNRASSASRGGTVYQDSIDNKKSAPDRSKNAVPTETYQPARNAGQINAQEDEQERMEERKGRKSRQKQEAEDFGNGTTSKQVRE